MYFKAAILHVAVIILALLYPVMAGAQDPGYGPPQDRQWQSSDGMLKLRAWPWQVFDGSDSLQAWLLERRLFAVPGERALDFEYRINLSESLDGAVFLIRDLRRKRGKSRFSLLYACIYGNENEFVRLIDIYGELAILKNNEADIWPLVRAQVGAWCEEKPSDARRAAVLAEISTPPGQGIQPDEIETVLGIMNEHWGYFYQIDVEVYVLLKNGMAIRDPSRPVSDLDQRRSRELEPESWVEWRRQDGGYQIKSDEEWRRLDVKWVVGPAARGTRLAGNYEYNDVSGNPWFGTFITKANYTFRANGTYASSSSAQYGSGMAVADTTGSINIFSYCNEQGGRSVFSAVGPNTDSSGLTSPAGTPSYVARGNDTNREGCGDGKGGAYILDGYTVELQANNGVTQRLPFYLLSENWVVVNWRWYAK